MVESTGLKLAPLRKFDDFLGSSARFALPDFQNLPRWNNRMLNNCLYYQSNYFLFSALIYTVFLWANPAKALIGLTIISVGWLWCLDGAGTGLSMDCLNVQLARLQTNRNVQVTAAAVGIATFLILYAMSAVSFILLMILLPAFGSLVHASLRLRNIRNRLSNAVFKATFSHTPMELLLTKCAITLDDLQTMSQQHEE